MKNRWVDPEVAERCGIELGGTQVPEEKKSNRRNVAVDLLQHHNDRNLPKSIVESV